MNITHAMYTMRNANTTRTASTMRTANIVQSKAGGTTSAGLEPGGVALRSLLCYAPHHLYERMLTAFDGIANTGQQGRLR